MFHKTCTGKHVLAVVLTVLPVLALGPQPSAAAEPPGDELPFIYELPNLFQFNDGKALTTLQQWEARREEIKDYLQYYEYGYIHEPDRLTASRTGNTLRVDMEVDVKDASGQVVAVKTAGFSVAVTIPTADQYPAAYQNGALIEKLPTFIGGNPLTTNGQITGQQLGYASVATPNVSSDTSAGLPTGVYWTLFPYVQGDVKYDTGTLIAQAWGFHRVVDALKIRNAQYPDGLFPEIDDTRLITYGFSRGGKIAMLASAFDERLYMTWVGHSGQFGASTIRYTYDSKKYPAGNNANATSYTAAEMDPASFYSGVTGARKEQIDRAYDGTNYFRWFTSRLPANFGQENKHQLPIDHHMTLALIAPRPLMVFEGMDDFWNGAESVAISVNAARLAYQMYEGTGAYRAGYGYEDYIGYIASPKLAHATNNTEKANFYAMAQLVLRGIDPRYGSESTAGYVATATAPVTVMPGFEYNPFAVTDPSAMPWAFPGQYSLGTTPDLRLLVEGTKRNLTILSDAPAVQLLSPTGGVLDTAATFKGRATIRLDADEDPSTGPYTLRTVGSKKVAKQVKIPFYSWEFMMRPEITTIENSWYISFPERINNLGEDQAIFYYDTRSAAELAGDMWTGNDPVPSVQVQNFGVMLRSFQIHHKVGIAGGGSSAASFGPAFPAPSRMFIDNLQFPDLFPGFTFDLQMDIAPTLAN
ncbi:MAG: hypothetical protein WDO72_06475 [Pseudomonadota bacterium]